MAGYVISWPFRERVALAAAMSREYLIAILGSRPSSRRHDPWRRERQQFTLDQPPGRQSRVPPIDSLVPDRVNTPVMHRRQQSLQTDYWKTSAAQVYPTRRKVRVVL